MKIKFKALVMGLNFFKFSIYLLVYDLLLLDRLDRLRLLEYERRRGEREYERERL